MDPSDADLLRRYAQEGSEAAFHELVQRHVDLVYAVAWRHLRSSADAADVAQSVFTDLARSARSLSPDRPLVAWLHVVARRTACDVVRAEQRRRAREQAAAELATTNAPASEWQRIEPLLDEVMETLSDDDRHALLLRFFENRSLRDVGTALGVSDDAAQKRVSRALEHLRAGFVRLGVASVAAGLAVSVPAEVVLSAPAGLASSIATAALPVAGLAPATAATAAGKTLMVTSLVLALGLVWEVRLLATGNGQLAELLEQTAALEPATKKALAERDLANASLNAAQQRVKVSRVRSTERTATESALDAWLARVNQLKALIEKSPTQSIPEMRYLQSADWLAVTRDNPLKTEMQRRRALGELRRIAKFKPEINRNFSQALAALAQEHDGKWPEGTSDLRPYLNPQLGDELLARYGFAHADRLVAPGEPTTSVRVFQEKSAVDEDFDVRMAFYETGGSGMSVFNRTDSLNASLQRAFTAFGSANSGQAPNRPEQLLPYLPASVDPADFKDFWAALQLPPPQ